MKKALIGFNIENGKEVAYNLDSLTQHAAVVGTTGSGKTVMCKVLIEEALAQGIPVIAIDPKGDIGGLGITSRNFDFRPFALDPKKIQALYSSNFYNPATLNKLCATKTKIFTPKSSKGIQVSLVPELTAPKSFREELEKDSSLAASLVEPLSESICRLADISNNYEKAKSLISSIIIHNWSLGKDLTIELLINQVIKPPFESVGSLSLENFLKENERLKIASSINLILSSPAKQAWKSGHKMNIESMLQPGNLSIFDVRYTGALEDKQYAVEQILQELYRFLLNKSGTDELKYILYIDEIAGLFPPPPSSPPCKKLLETLIRQSRAFGLGIILATQNPGDIDYKVLGNIGTRFIGKLRTENDVDKVATAIGIPHSILKQTLITFKAGDFFYNNSVDNKSLKMRSRWAYTYHSGPLHEKEIYWINHPETKPLIERPLELLSKSHTKVSQKNFPDKQTLEILKRLKTQVAKYSDKSKALIAQSALTDYIPLLSITIEPKPFKNKKFPLMGPYIFDLTNKTNPDITRIHANNWKPIRKQAYRISRPKRSIKKSIYQAIKDSQSHLKKRLYSSTVVDIIGEEKDKVINFNYDYMRQELVSATKLLIEKGKRKEAAISKLLEANVRKLNAAQNRVRAIKAGRLVRKLFGNDRLSRKTKRIKKIETAVRRLKRKSKIIKLKIKNSKRENREEIKALESKLYRKAHTLTKSLSYNPPRNDLIVHANILLFPSNKEVNPSSL